MFLCGDTTASPQVGVIGFPLVALITSISSVVKGRSVSLGPQAANPASRLLLGTGTQSRDPFAGIHAYGLTALSETLLRQWANRSVRSTSIATISPATIAQNADVMPAIENGVAATPNATNAEKRSVLPNDFSNASCNAESTASPASAIIYARGNTPINDITGVAAIASRMVRLAPITLAQ